MTILSRTNASHTEWPFPFDRSDWEKTPPAVQAYLWSVPQRLDQLQQQIDELQGRLDKTAHTSSKPPSSESPFTRPQRSKGPKASGKRGARQGHRGRGPTLLAPTAVQHLYLAPCACGHGALTTPTLYHTHQRSELPPIDMQITHFLLHQARCVGWGSLLKAAVPSPYATGYGPRLSSLIGERSGMHGPSRRLMQNFCHSVLPVPIRVGAIQKIIDRVSCALIPP
jgi:transposase